MKKRDLFVILFIIIAVAAVTVGQPAAPVLVSPESMERMDNGCFDRSNGIEWDFEWAAVPNAKKYHLFVKSNAAPIPVIYNMGLKETVYKHRSEKSYIGGRPSTWSWRVRALVGKIWTEWSTEREFYVEPLDTDCK